MRALVFDEQLKYVEGHEAPLPEKGEALIKVTSAGICNTDLEIIKGYMGFKGIPGHEFTGVVQQCDAKELEGKRVVGEINIGCGKCSFCRENVREHCADRSVLGILNKDGVFAEYVTLPVSNLHLIPDSVTDDEAVFTEPLAAAFEILEQVDIGPLDKVCVLGDGKLGILVAQVLATTGCGLTAVGNHSEKLAILEALGIKTAPGASFNEKGFDVVVDCTGSALGIEKALNIVRPRGRVVMKTTVADKGGIDLNNIVINEITVTGSRCGPFDRAMKAIEEKKVITWPLITASYGLAEGLKAFEHAAEKSTLKILFKM
jgi:threonine dehydrogenase-like Zn-dependent dehydrogenase